MIGVFVTTALAIAVSAALALRLRYRRQPSAADLRWVDEFTITAYRPMERLLAEADWAFLASRHGCDPRLCRRLRRQRRELMRRYLRRLVADYSRIQGVARLKVARSAAEGPGFPAFLLMQGMIFDVGVIWLRTALALDAVCGAVVLDVRPLLDAVGQLLERARGPRHPVAPAI